MLESLEQGQAFSGVKVVLLLDNQVVTILRDDKPNIPYPNMWDLPGGEREQGETVLECLQREVWEELGLVIRQKDILWAKAYQGIVQPQLLSVFMVATIVHEDFDRIIFGDDGQAYQLMEIDEFLASDRVIPQLKARLYDFLKWQKERKNNGQMAGN